MEFKTIETNENLKFKLKWDTYFLDKLRQVVKENMLVYMGVETIELKDVYIKDNRNISAFNSKDEIISKITLLISDKTLSLDFKEDIYNADVVSIAKKIKESIFENEELENAAFICAGSKVEIQSLFNLLFSKFELNRKSLQIYNKFVNPINATRFFNHQIDDSKTGITICEKILSKIIIERIDILVNIGRKEYEHLLENRDSDYFNSSDVNPSSNSKSSLPKWKLLLSHHLNNGIMSEDEMIKILNSNVNKVEVLKLAMEMILNEAY